MKAYPKVGDKVVVSKAVDTVVYTVSAIANGMANLEYQDGGRTLLGGSFPAMHCMKPTQAQLANSPQA
jgi:hypothetical protein